MTGEELANELKIKESYLKTHWNKIVNNRAKIGIVLVKKGRGAETNYGIKNYDDIFIRWETKKDE